MGTGRIEIGRTRIGRTRTAGMGTIRIRSLAQKVLKFLKIYKLDSCSGVLGFYFFLLVFLYRVPD
jgi:hypothetical protein